MLTRRSLISLGLFVLGSLGAVPATAQSQNCIGGVTAGNVQLPAAGMPGMVHGDLRIGSTGPSVFQFKGMLNELAPTPAGHRRGGIKGVLLDGNGMRKFRVLGRWVAGPNGEGVFHCFIRRILPSGQVGPIVGRMRARFTHGASASGAYEGHWTICP
jgi:hypothetical protein